MLAYTQVLLLKRDDLNNFSPLLFIAFFTSNRSPPSGRLEQAKFLLNIRNTMVVKSAFVSVCYEARLDH